MRMPPPILERRPPGAGTCGRRLPSGDCGARAAWHLLSEIDGELENFLSCDRHAIEAAHRWRIDFQHEYRFPCTQPGAMLRWTTDEHGVRRSECYLPDEPAAEAARASERVPEEARA